MASTPPRLLVTPTTYLVLALVFPAVAALPAAAQTVIGERGNPSVTVDLSVLDQLGPAPTLPDRLRDKAQRPAAKIARPLPEDTAAAPKEKRAAKPKPKVAARPAAPVRPVATSTATATPAGPRDKVVATPLSAPAPAATAVAETPVETPAPAAAAAVTAPAGATPPVKPAPTPPPAITPTTFAPTTPPPATPPRSLPTATASPDARTAMNAPPVVAPAPPQAPVTPAAAPAAVVGSMRIGFTPGDAKLTDANKSVLDGVARQLIGNDHTRLQLVGYAGAGTDEANQARRVSLQRALAVRTYLMERGVANTRMDVRALGNRAEGSDPTDRVDIVTVDR